MIKKEDVLKIGHFTKPHGIKGEIGLVTDYFLFEESDDPYIICEIDGILVPFYIEEYRHKTDTVILVKMENVDSEDKVRKFINKDVYYPAGNIDNSNINITWDNFIGYTVSDKELGTLGEIKEIDESTINVLLHVDYNGKELLIPAADELITNINHTEKQLIVSLPDGLLDL